jgi:predicted amidophosphoribosyltransferase
MVICTQRNSTIHLVKELVHRLVSEFDTEAKEEERIWLVHIHRDRHGEREYSQGSRVSRDSTGQSRSESGEESLVTTASID